MRRIQAHILYKYNDHVFIEWTFYFAPKSPYQVIEIRIHNILEEIFYNFA